MIETSVTGYAMCIWWSFRFSYQKLVQVRIMLGDLVVFLLRPIWNTFHTVNIIWSFLLNGEHRKPFRITLFPWFTHEFIMSLGGAFHR